MPFFIPNIQFETYAKIDQLIAERWEAAKIFYNDPEIPKERIQKVVYAIYGLYHLIDQGTELKPKKENQPEYADAI
jgi:hypothetical protein